MLNSSDITDAILGEAQFLAHHTNFDAAPTATPEEKFAKSVAQFPLPDRPAISHVIEEVFWASLLTEENRICKPRLLYLPRDRELSKALHKFEAPLQLNRNHLRKLSPAQGPRGYLAWDNANGEPEIIGVQGRQAGEPCELAIASPGRGALDVSWWCFRILALRAGEIRRLSTTRLPEIQRGLDIVRQVTGHFPPVFLGNTIQAIARDGHGGAVWIIRENVSLEGLHVKHSVLRDHTPLLERHHELRIKWLESVGHLSAVDGAVLVDSQLHVLGFGAFITVPDSAKYVNCISGAGTTDRLQASELGGGRHRSAVEFCCRYAPAAAIVVSEDGRVSLIWATDPDQPFWAPFSVLGFNDGHISSE
jgi:hypothetical protein